MRLKQPESLLPLLATLAACGGGGGGSAPPTVPLTYTVGGTVTGLAGTGLVLTLNGGNDLAVASDGAFVFPTGLRSGVAYETAIRSRPSAPAQSCAVFAGSGTIAAANVTAIEVICRPSTGRFLYVTADSPIDIPAYSIDPDTGALAPLGGSPVPSGNNPRAAVVGPDESLLVVPNFGSGNVSVYHRDALTGALSEVTGSPYAVAGGNPRLAVFGPTGAWLYVPHGASSLTVFAVDAATGALTAGPGSPYAVGGNPERPVLVAGGRFVYLPSNGTNELFGFESDAVTGALTATPGSPYAADRSNDIAVEPGERFLYLSGATTGAIAAFSIDAVSGALTELAGSPFGAGLGGGPLAVDASGSHLLAAGESGGAGVLSSFAIDAATGALTLAGGSPVQVGSSNASFRLHPEGAFIYAWSLLGSSLLTVSLDRATGRLTLLDTMAIPFLPSGLVMDRSGLYAYASDGNGNDVHRFRIHPLNGSITRLDAVFAGPLPREGAIVGSH